MKYVLCSILLIISLEICAQQDTIRTPPFSMSWTKPRLVPRFGIAVQETGSIEAGLAYHKIFVHPLSLASSSFYLAGEGMVRDDNFVFGPKAGYEFTVGLIGLALDATYYTDTHKNTFVITPKGGLTIFGFVSLYYGRNISLSNVDFDYISQNRFSITFHVNRDYFDLKEAPKKKLR
jgi:hypothetical protein